MTSSLRIRFSHQTQGYKSNDESLNELAVRCGDLMVNITKHAQSGSNMSEGMNDLVSDLYQ